MREARQYSFPFLIYPNYGAKLHGANLFFLGFVTLQILKVYLLLAQSVSSAGQSASSQRHLELNSHGQKLLQ